MTRRIERDGDALFLAVLPDRIELHLARDSADVLGTQHRIFRDAISRHRRGHARQNGAHMRIVHTQHGAAIEGQALQEFDKRAFELFEVVAVGIHVVGVDIGDDRDDGREQEEGRIRLIGFGHQKFARTQTCVRSGSVQFAANHKGRIKAGRFQNAGGQARRRGLAVRAGNRDALLEAHQLGQHLRARHHRNLAGARRDHFRVVFFHCTGNHHHIGASNMFSGMPLRHACAGRSQALGRRIAAQIRAAHLETEIEQDLGNAAHADTANAYEMNVFDFVFHRLSVRREELGVRCSPAHPASFSIYSLV